MDIEAVFGAGRPVVGMVHLPPLPEAPQFDADAGRDALHAAARRDATRLDAGGVDAIIVENFGDAPFHPESVPQSVVAELTALVDTVCDATDCPIGVNVLRNDGPAAMAVAAATGASFIRSNVHIGARVADQGVLSGRAHETMRVRDRLDADVRVLADVAVKHSAPLGQASADLDSTVADAVDRGLADGVIVSGSATGRETASETVRAAVAARDDSGLDAPVFVGSGVTVETVADTLAVADGVIVGSALEADGEAGNPVSVERVERLVAAADNGR